MSCIKLISTLVVLPVLFSILFEEGACQNRKSGTAAQARKAMPTKTTKAPNGIWGAQRAQLNTTDRGAMIAFDCARGTIDEPLVLDSNGRFDVAGTYTQEHPGPEREGEDNSQPARYTGSVNGKTLTLEIKLTGREDSIGPLTFSFGKLTHLVKCL